MSKPIPEFISSSFRLGTRESGSIGQFERFELINMYFGLESERDGKKYKRQMLPKELTSDHVAVLTILLPPNQWDKQTYCKCERLLPKERASFLKAWNAWSRYLHREISSCAPNKGVPIWLAASSGVSQYWSPEDFWSALSFAEKPPVVSQDVLQLPSTSFVGRPA